MPYIKNIIITVSLLPLLSFTTQNSDQISIAQNSDQISAPKKFESARSTAHVVTKKIVNSAFDAAEKAAIITIKAKDVASKTYHSKNVQDCLKTTKNTMCTAVNNIKNITALKAAIKFLIAQKKTILLATPCLMYIAFIIWLIKHSNEENECNNEEVTEYSVISPTEDIKEIIIIKRKK